MSTADSNEGEDLKMLSQKTLFIQQNHEIIGFDGSESPKLEDIEQRLNGIESSIQISQQEADVANQQFELAKEMVKTDQTRSMNYTHR